MTQSRNMLHNIMAMSIFMVVTIALIPGCTSEPKRVSIPASANINDELVSLSEDLKIAQQNQVDVMSPRNFEKAETHFAKARAATEKNKDHQDILDSVGMAKAYLILANEHATRAKPSAADILKAREDAIQAKAHQLLPKKFNQADSSLKSATLKAEKTRSSVEANRRADLQKNYLDAQIEAIKLVNLKPIENTIDTAKDSGARRYAPRTLASAKAKYEITENLIETDRNNQIEIKRASESAKNEATKALNVANIAKNSKVSESVALELNARRRANERLSSELSDTESELSSTEQQLMAERAEAEQMKAENAALAQKNQFNESFAWAQEQFKPNEAEVFRQGDQLLIRLKSMKYKSGQSELSSSAYPVLAKVKEVIAKMGAEKVRVEGHTDSTGKKALNEELSQERAENVAEYIADDKVISKNQVEAEGLGFEKPVSNNTTTQGRAQNRRVDVIIVPSQLSAGSSVE